MPPSGLAESICDRAGRAVARTDNRNLPVKRRPALSGGDGTFPGSIRSIGQAVDAHALWISPIHDLPTQNARAPASAHASALFHSICLALVLALIVAVSRWSRVGTTGAAPGGQDLCPKA